MTDTAKTDRPDSPPEETGRSAEVTPLRAAKADPQVGLSTTPASETLPGNGGNGGNGPAPEFQAETGLDAPGSHAAESFDRAFKSQLAKMTLGVTPFGMSSTFFSWALHLAGSPGKQAHLVEKAARKWARYLVYSARSVTDPECGPCIQPLPHDHRFDDPAWQQWPYNLIYQGFLLHQQWWYNATNEIDGLSRHEEQVVSFVTRQILDMWAPANFPWTNPKVMRETARTGGRNLLQGWQHFIEDWQRVAAGKPPAGAEDFVPGRQVAVTPGRVVFRSHLMELIQYAPQTETVQAEPIVIVPAWIMKYYILDLSPHNSLVNYLVSQGFTVFMISWRNPSAEDRDLGMADYLAAVDEAFTAATKITGADKVHAAGYCLGGTLLSIKAAAMARDGDDRLKTMSLFAAQTDFKEPGELQLFISDSEVAFLDDVMWDQGYLDTKQMAGAFQLLRSNDLIWSRYIEEYLMGRRGKMFDLMAWNADPTRMPYRMHSEYLHRLFLDNALSQGQYEVDGTPVALKDIDAPIFCVGTETDHVAPWRSVYKIHLLADTDITFVLTKGGHNAGIVTEPGHPHRSYRIRSAHDGEHFLSPDAWQETAERHEGSWWEAFSAWLAERSSGTVAPPPMGQKRGRYQPLEPAPGTYVHQL